MDSYTQQGASPVVQWAMQQQSQSPTISSPPPSVSDNQMSPVVQWANNPDDVNSANADKGDQNYDNLCEAFAEQQVYGKTGIFPTASAAWNTYVGNGQAQSMPQNGVAPAGSLVYFAPDQSNHQEGHVAISDGQGNIIGATSGGVQSYPLTQWIQQTGQTPLGFVVTQK